MFNVNGNPTSATGINNRGAVVVAYTVVNCGPGFNCSYGDVRSPDGVITRLC
jgi:hypothetical protein